MANVAATRIGTFIWADLSSPDLEATKSFYGNLLGWTAEAVADPQAGGYTFFRKDGKLAAAGMPLMGEGRPAWSNYLGANDARALLAAATNAGARVLMEPMDVMGQGSVAMFMDPTGAACGIWQPAEMQGAEGYGDPGFVCWNELQTRDLRAAINFYTQVVGWTTRENDMGGTPYVEFLQDDRSVAGCWPTPSSVPAEVPSFWLVYFRVEDADAVAKRATELGGKVMSEPSDVPGVGRFAVLTDPHGAVFGILK